MRTKGKQRKLYTPLSFKFPTGFGGFKGVNGGRQFFKKTQVYTNSTCGFFKKQTTIQLPLKSTERVNK